MRQSSVRRSPPSVATVNPSPSSSKAAAASRIWSSCALNDWRHVNDRRSQTLTVASPPVISHFSLKCTEAPVAPTHNCFVCTKSFHRMSNPATSSEASVSS